MFNKIEIKLFSTPLHSQPKIYGHPNSPWYCGRLKTNDNMLTLSTGFLSTVVQGLTEDAQKLHFDLHVNFSKTICCELK